MAVNQFGASDSSPSHAASTAALCACSLVNAYLLISVFPYAGYMVMELVPGVTQDNVGTYAGLLASFFMAGRTVSAYCWGKAADAYGRVFVLNACLLLSAAFSLFFGVAGSLQSALFWRFCLGLANGIISATKTVATELADGDHGVERRAMGLVIGMRSWGYLVSPALGGILSDPIGQYPDAAWLRRGWIGHLLSKYPFLLPNLVAFVGCVVTAVLVTYFVHETLPESKRRPPSDIPGDLLEWIHCKLRKMWFAIKFCLCPRRRSPEAWRFLPETHKDAPLEQETESVWGRVRTRQHLLAHWMYSFVSMCADELFPLFCMSAAGGLGRSEGSIGKILSGAGLIFAVCQYPLFSIMVHHFGEYTCITIGSVFGIQPATLIPLSLLLRSSPWGVFSLLSVIMAICKLFGLLFFTSLALSINKTVPASQRATMNGLVVTGASLMRAIAPTFGGMLASFSFSSLLFPAEYGSLLMYGTLSIISAFVTSRVSRLRYTSDEGDGKEITIEPEDVPPVR